MWPGFTRTVEKMKIVLFHVEPMISQYLVDEAKTKPGAYAELQKLMRKSQQAARVLLEKDKALMVSSGVAETDIQIMSLPRKFGTAKDILEYGTALLYDAIIVGRRGLLRPGGSLCRQRQRQYRGQLPTAPHLDS
jgi:helix-turn-helix protein